MTGDPKPGVSGVRGGIRDPGSSQSQGGVSSVPRAANRSGVPYDPSGLDVARKIAATSGRKPSPGSDSDSPAKRRPRARKPGDLESVGVVLAEVIESSGWTTRIGLANLLGRWPELVGEVNASHSKPEAYADRVLTVRAESTTWATSLRQLAPHLVAALNEKLGDGTVERIVVIGPQAPSWKKGRRSVPGRGPRDTYG